MGLLDRYVLLSFLRVFGIVTFGSVALITLYGFTDFFIAFKNKSVELALEYISLLIPLGFYILSPMLMSISLIVVFRRFFSKNIDLTAQSFSLSPLRFSLPILLFSLFLSFAFAVLNESFLPSMFRGVWYIETKYKREGEEKGRIVEKLWFVKRTERGSYYIYLDNLETESGRFSGLYMLRVSEEGEVEEVVEGRSGVWKGNVIHVDRGSAYNFLEGFFIKNLSDFSMGIEVALKEIGLFAEKIEHVSSSSLLTLYTKGARIGFDTNRYFSELMFRAGMSFFPFMLSLTTLWGLFRSRKPGFGGLSFLFGVVVGWLIIISPKILADKAGLPPQYALVGYASVGLFLLKGLYDLGKGFRV